MEPELEPVASTSYEGSADAKGRWDGHGRVSFKSGALYEGEWSAGRMHGRGKLTFPDGIVYEGEFNNNQLTGNGVYMWPSGAMYEGAVVAGKRQGRGKLSFTRSAAVYDGEWRDGLRHGQGVLYTNTQRTSYYRGSWMDDTKHGSGVMKYESGDWYDGQWENDTKNGLGTMRWESTKQQYSGEWDNNAPNGVGLHVWLGEGMEPGVPTHAQLLSHNRYYGHFKNGRRHGYGVLYYATGARYEGYWQADLKHGQGCYVFENGEVWAGAFAADRPLLGPSEVFAPSSPGVALAIDDLAAEEENPATSKRAVANLLLCYNTELRMLYDKYCKRPSHHLYNKLPRTNFSILAAQFWDLANDCRLLSPSLTFETVDAILATSRMVPARLRAFRQQETAALTEAPTPAQRRFWANLASEHTPGGPHCPTGELSFRAFAEALVRLAAARFHDLPSLERRLHRCLTQHLLHLVNKAKAVPPAPPQPMPLLPPNTSVEAAVAAAEAVRPALVTMFLRAAAAGSGGHAAVEAAAEAAGLGVVEVPAVGAAAGDGGGPASPEGSVHCLTASAAALAAELAAAGAAGPGLYQTLTVRQAQMVLLWNYMTRNAVGTVQRMTMDTDEEASYRTCLLGPDDEAELLLASGQSLTFAEFCDGVWRVAADWTHPDAWLGDRLAAAAGVAMAAAPPAQGHRTAGAHGHRPHGSGSEAEPGLGERQRSQGGGEQGLAAEASC